MKYLVFAGDDYYPVGGFNDLRGVFPSLEEAKDSLIGNHHDWWHIVRLHKTHIELVAIQPFESEEYTNRVFQSMRNEIFAKQGVGG